VGGGTARRRQSRCSQAEGRSAVAAWARPGEGTTGDSGHHSFGGHGYNNEELPLPFLHWPTAVTPPSSSWPVAPLFFLHGGDCGGRRRPSSSFTVAVLRWLVVQLLPPTTSLALLHWLATWALLAASMLLHSEPCAPSPVVSTSPALLRWCG
jgi:hypothetical protein